MRKCTTNHCGCDWQKTGKCRNDRATAPQHLESEQADVGQSESCNGLNAAGKNDHPAEEQEFPRLSVRMDNEREQCQTVDDSVQEYPACVRINGSAGGNDRDCQEKDGRKIKRGAVEYEFIFSIQNR